jgi:hypothetical protein
MKKVVSGLLALLLIAAIPILTTIKVKAASPDIYYEWNFNGNLNEENGANALTLSDKSTSGGYQFTNDGTIALSLGSTDFILEKPFTVTNELDWSIEWRGKTTDVCALFGAQSKATPYFYLAGSVNYGGEIDYIKVWTQTKEIVDVNQQSTETTVPEVTTKAPTTSAPITTTETPVTDTTPGITSVPETEAPKKSGCGSAISVFTLVAAVLASAAVIKKR